MASDLAVGDRVSCYSAEYGKRYGTVREVAGDSAVRVSWDGVGGWSWWDPKWLEKENGSNK